MSPGRKMPPKGCGRWVPTVGAFGISWMTNSYRCQLDRDEIEID